MSMRRTPFHALSLAALLGGGFPAFAAAVTATPNDAAIRPGHNPHCRSCQQAFQSACWRRHEDAAKAARTVNYAALAACAATFAEMPPGALICLAATLSNFQSTMHSAKTNSDNCISLIPQTCYLQCR